MEDNFEIWKSIPGWEGIYEASSLGRIRSYYKNPYQLGEDYNILQPWINQTGYSIVKLGRKNNSVHRLVAFAFLENPNNYPVINHKNNIRTDNRVENLEWCTQQYNSQYAFDSKSRVGSSTGKFGKDNYFSKPVGKYDKQGNFIERFDSTRLAAISVSNKKNAYKNLSMALTGKSKTAYGWIWKFLEK